MAPHAVAVGPDCLNCGAALEGPFCAKCGQKAAPPVPTLHELLHDALEEFLHFDGKIVQTLRTLIARPGQLTVDTIAGRRARYIAPLRLYLTVSVVYFLIAAAGPSNLRVGIVESRGVRVQSPRDITDEDRQRLLQQADASSPLIRPLIRRAVEDPIGLQRDVFASWPKALFVLLPVFAGLVALFHRRRHFVEHMHFALHVHAFAFLAMTIPAAAALTHVRWLSIPAGVFVLVWIPVYVHLAFRRVYGETHALTALKETGVGVLYGAASVPAMLIAALWAASHPH